MPIKGVTGRVRAPRTCKIRLGYKKKGTNGDYPKDSDVFVLRSDDAKDDIAKSVRDAYEATRITDAEGEVYSLGKSLRMMLPWDFDLTYEGQEVGLELMNRAWSHSKLRCFGTGGDEAGTAVCRDEEMAVAIGKATKHKLVEKDEGRGSTWDVVCMGPRCVFWHSNQSKNKAATCHREMRLWAWLLHPTTDPNDKNWLKKIASVEIASGSFNGMLDVQSGFRTIQSLVQRTALIPFTLRRVPRIVISDGKRVVKSTLLVDFDQDEVIRFGYSDPQLALVRPEIRKQLVENKREELQLRALASRDPDFDSFKDVVPRLEEARPGLPAPAVPTAEPADVAPADQVVTDRDDVVDGARAAAADEPGQLTEAELNRFLSQGERNELKALAGGKLVDGTFEASTLGRIRELVRRVYVHFEEEQGGFNGLRVRHSQWIREHLDDELEASA